MPKTKMVYVRMDPEFHGKVKQYCADRSIKTSEAIRATLRDALTLAGYYERPQVDGTPGHGIIDG